MPLCISFYKQQLLLVMGVYACVEQPPTTKQNKNNTIAFSNEIQKLKIFARILL